MSDRTEGRADGIRFTLNETAVTALAGESILQAAQRHGVEIPHLCYQEGLRADGNCRACMVEIDGERVLAASCCRQPSPGMEVRSRSERALHAQKLVLELLQSDLPHDRAGYTRHNELDHWSDKLGVDHYRFPSRSQPAPDNSHPAIAVRLDACIQCGRCLRACRETQANDVIGFFGRASALQIGFDLDDPMGQSSCVACGECVQTCPTGALMPASDVALQPVDRQVHSVCPYCGVGCQLTYHVRDNRILYVNGRDGPANHGRLCVKGRYGFDYVSHRQRLTKPLIRRADAPKRAAMDMDYDNPLRDFREAEWDEALRLAADGLLKIRERAGPRGLAGFGSAKGSNEEAYLFQKLVRTGFGSNNVDHCTRLCHASSVAALLQMIGSGAVSNPVADVAQAEVILLIGANPTANHPVAATFFKNAARAGKTLIVMDPRRTEIARHADHFLQFNPDTDVALLNAILHAVIELDLVDRDFIESRTEGYAALKAHLADYSPARMAPVCGIPAETLYEVARVYAGSRGSMIFWGMGISQHIHGTDNARCLINLALISGQIGRPGSGLHPLRGQNNVQGASDVGLIPMVYPDYQRVDDPAVRQRFEALWGVPLDPEPGLTVVEIMHAIEAGDIRGMYIMGENPAMSDPNLNQARQALASLEHLVVQDIFMTETAHYADVILPASAFPEKDGTFTNTDRRVQLGRRALDPPSEARQDLEIITELARRLGLTWDYSGPREVFAEMRQAMPSIAGITWERLQAESAVTYPCEREGDPGTEVIFTDTFPRPGGRAALIPAAFTQADELPDANYPWILITGRQLEHWHTGAMTRRASVLDALQPRPLAMLHPQLLQQLGVTAGEPIRIRSRRGEIVVAAQSDRGLQPGQIFLPFCYYEAAANLLTNEALDPDGKIPEFKFSAVWVEPA
ncbi:formate dehydrogenase subunit alpha [Sedimenticola hydrogenitrophicus]|uniref:formate dehydrogenase subunit alpha n=1 Tax=Sedimenticola hydrogenitrophicus TaxID=2967975 RepID=UPI0021A3C3F6|nr:formate dehydrogenase subunit alpha [Sedimenticola hydrogenitrophicus]